MFVHIFCMYTCTSVFIKCEMRHGWLALGCISHHLYVFQKWSSLPQLNLSEFVTPCFIRGIVVDYSLVDTLQVLGFVLLTFL